ncbi:MAG TPA: protein kinase, partial [Polyangiales bacterium]|nr:protein kinase [Polyangiales bacterium]
DVGVPYMVMELLKGETLAARMDREPRLRLDEILGYADAILRGLAAVHEAGIVHRDLKPQNIFLHRDDESEDAKILDFGISRSLSSGAERRPSVVTTEQGLLIGTPHYMSPEQARGEAAIDKRSDIYSMGAILYEAITGRTPFDGETPGELLMKIMSSDPAPLRTLRLDVPSLLSDCVGQAMARDRDHRFLDAKVFRRALHSAAEALAANPAAISGEESKPKPVANANAGWGDFEGLGNRSNPPPMAASTRAVSSPPGGSGSRPPPSAAASPAGTRAEGRPISPARSASGPITPARSASGPITPARSASGPITPARSASGPVAPARAASGPITPARAASGPIAPVRAASGPLAPARAASGSLARASQARAEFDEIPLIGSANDGPLLGDHPLDAFAETSALNLEVDYGPGGRAQPVRRSPMPAQGKRPGMTGHAAAGFEDRKRRTGYDHEQSRFRWLLPALLLLFIALVLVAPSLFSAAPPDQTDAIQREARNPATRDSARRLSTAEPSDRSNASPALRALQY